MKRIIVMSCLVIVSAMSALAQDNNRAKIAKERADRLSDQMIRELRLNNFQANRLRTINQEKVNKMMAIEQKYASDPALVDKNCKGICRERDQELESFLSLDQYGKYYGNRTEFYNYDKDFAAKIGLVKPRKETNPLERTVPANTSVDATAANDPVLRPDTNK